MRRHTLRGAVMSKPQAGCHTVQFCGILYVMNKADYSQNQSQAPRDTPAPLNSFIRASSNGGNIKNFRQNHPTFTQSFTRSDEAPVQQAPPVAAEIVKPGEYHPTYIKKMLEFFDRPKNKKIHDTYTWKSGAVTEKVRYTPNTPPHFSEFARSIGASTRKLRNWAQKYPEFGDAYETCQEIFEEFLIDNGLTGEYGAIAMKFVAVNRTTMKDKQVHENRTLDMNAVLDKIAAGEVKPGGVIELDGNERR